MANVQAHEVRFYNQKPHTDKTETVKGVKGTTYRSAFRKTTLLQPQGNLKTRWRRTRKP